MRPSPTDWLNGRSVYYDATPRPSGINAEHFAISELYAGIAVLIVLAGVVAVCLAERWR